MTDARSTPLPLPVSALRSGERSQATETFRAARDFLLANREDYVTAYDRFRWPEFD